MTMMCGSTELPAILDLGGIVVRKDIAFHNLADIRNLNKWT